MGTDDLILYDAGYRLRNDERGPGSSDPAEAPAAASAGTKGPAEANVGYVEKITFDKTTDKEKIIISTSKLSGYTASREAAKTLVITLDRMYVPDDLKKKITGADLKVVEGVYPTQDENGRETRHGHQDRPEGRPSSSRARGGQRADRRH